MLKTYRVRIRWLFGVLLLFLAFAWGTSFLNLSGEVAALFVIPFVFFIALFPLFACAIYVKGKGHHWLNSFYIFIPFLGPLIIYNLPDHYKDGVMNSSSQETTESIFRMIENRLPLEHPLREVKKRFDFSSIEVLYHEKYGITPDFEYSTSTIVKILLLMALYNVNTVERFDNELFLHLDWLWFLDFPLENKNLSSHTLSHIRRELREDKLIFFATIAIRRGIQAGFFVNNGKTFKSMLFDGGHLNQGDIDSIDHSAIVAYCKRFVKNFDFKQYRNFNSFANREIKQATVVTSIEHKQKSSPAAKRNFSEITFKPIALTTSIMKGKLNGLSFENRIHPLHPIRKLKEGFPYESLSAVIENDDYLRGLGRSMSEQLWISIKIMLLCIIYSVNSRWELKLSLPLRLDWLWFLGLDIEQGGGIAGEKTIDFKIPLKKEVRFRILKILAEYTVDLYTNGIYTGIPFLNNWKKAECYEKKIIKGLTGNLKKIERSFFLQTGGATLIIINNYTTSVDSFSTQAFADLESKTLLPQAHPLWVLKEKLNIESIANELEKKIEAESIRKLPVPLPVLLRMIILLTIYDINSEHELLLKTSFRLDWLWFLDYNLKEAQKGKSVFSRAQKVLGKHHFESIFNAVFVEIVNTRIIDGTKLFWSAFSIDRYMLKNSREKINASDIKCKYEEFSKNLRFKSKDPEILLGRISDTIYKRRNTF